MKTFLVLSGIFCVCLLAGCDKPAADAVKASLDTGKSGAPASQPAGPKEKTCFACAGSGTIKCAAPGCVDGVVDCPGPCIRLSRGVWMHMDVAGHPPTDLWQKFNEGNGQYTAFNQSHVGHVIAMQNGKVVDTGPCQLCGGSGKVPCRVCNGTGQVVCPVCDGRKQVPDSWTSTDNPWLNGQPDLIRLTDGRIVFGKVVGTVGTNLTIKTREGKWLHLNTAELVPNDNMVSTNATAP